MRGIDRQVACGVDRAEALRYLGYAGQALDGELAARIERVFAHAEEVARPAWSWRAFPVDVADGVALLEGSALRVPADGTLAHMRACAVMCCTAGVALDREARLLAVGEATEALVLDAAGSSLVEACADDCERAINAWAAGEGLHAGQRTSPGYGDLPLALSGDIIRALDAGKALGVSVTEAGLLVPMKSVTALVGLFEHEEDARRARRSCADCIVRTDCAYLKAGNPCNSDGEGGYS